MTEDAERYSNNAELTQAVFPLPKLYSLGQLIFLSCSSVLAAGLRHTPSTLCNISHDYQ